MEHPSQLNTVNSGSYPPMSSASLQRPQRPCDACRRRKTRCVVNAQNSGFCVMCEFHNQACTFFEDAAPRKRKAPREPENETPNSRPRSISNSQTPRPHLDTPGRTTAIISDYANLRGKSLLKKTLGLQNHRHTRFIGSSDQRDWVLLGLRQYDEDKGEASINSGSSTFRRVAPDTYFHQAADADFPGNSDEIDDLDQIEGLVAPHGAALIKLYFRIVHPSFPILHKKVYLEKYSRTYREFAPPLLAAVYILALNWWSYSSELAKLTKPDVAELESIAFRTLQEVAYHRPKLSTVQAGLLLLQNSGSNHVSSWQTTCLMVSIGQELGLHLDCSNWRIPGWERGLRKRLAWALFVQDTWSAMVLGRSPHISSANWAVQPVANNDFPENAADEDDEEGSTEVETGRTLFCAMITLTRIVAEVLEQMYSLRAEAEVQNSRDRTATVLAQAKPIQQKLKSWYAQMPGSLRMDATNLKVGKLNSVGYLHLAYFAAEIILHRQVIRSLSSKNDPYVFQICRSAAKARLVSATDFFDQLKAEHLQSFWHFAGTFNFALVGSFAGLCHVTATSHDEAEFYQRQLQGYAWKLRVSGRSTEFLRAASEMLDSVTEPLSSLTARNSGGRRHTYPLIQDDTGDENAPGGEGDEANLLDRFFVGAVDGWYDIPMEA